MPFTLAITILVVDEAVALIAVPGPTTTFAPNAVGEIVNVLLPVASCVAQIVTTPPLSSPPKVRVTFPVSVVAAFVANLVSKNTAPVPVSVFKRCSGINLFLPCPTNI
jgi:hypothetical protein